MAIKHLHVAATLDDLVSEAKGYASKMDKLSKTSPEYQSLLAKLKSCVSKIDKMSPKGEAVFDYSVRKHLVNVPKRDKPSLLKV